MYPTQPQAWTPASGSYSAPPGETEPPQVVVNNYVGGPVVYRKRHPWLIALLVILALAFWKVTLTLLGLALFARLAWHGYRATVAYNARRRQQQDGLRARCDLEDQLWAQGDSRGFYGLGFHQ